MTTIFRSCLPRFYSNTNQSISNEHLLNKINSFDDENSMECLSVISNQNTTTTPQLNSSSYKEKQSNQSSSKQISHFKNTNTKNRGPRYSRINEKSQSLLTRLIGTIFGAYGMITITNKKKRRSKKSLLPSKSTIKKQSKENEQTLRSFVTFLTQIESNVKLPSSTDIILNKNKTKNFSIEKEQARNNNRIDDDISSSHSNDTHHLKSKISKYYTKKRQSVNDTLDSCSIISDYLSEQKMIDNQQQTQLYPMKINIGTSTQLTSELSWLDIMREDQTIINAWTRIQRKLKPNQQKDILRALMIICANLFEISLENEHI